jgi:O-antigen/teichoic acid export membrane protein
MNARELICRRRHDGPALRQIVGVADQGVTSVSNLLLSVVVARQSTPGEFGMFGVAFALYLACLTVVRGVVGSVATLGSAQLGRNEAAKLQRYGFAAASGLGLGLGVLLTAGGLAIGNTGGALIAVLGAATPILLVQDTLRYFAFASHRGQIALLNDGVWLIGQVSIFAVLSLVGAAGTLEIFAAWAFSAVLGVIAALLRLRLAPTLRGGVQWFRRFGSLIRSMLTEQLFISGVAQGAPLIVGGIAGLAAVGSMRAAQTAFGPVTVLSTGLSMAIVPPCARGWAQGDLHFYRPLRRTGVVVGGLALMWSVFLVTAPDSLGTMLLGSSWEGARSVAIVTGTWMALGFASAPAISALRIIGRAWSSARARMVFAPIMLAGAAVGALEAGAWGATLGLAISTAGAAVTLWWLFGRGLARTLAERQMVADLVPASAPRSAVDGLGDPS